MLTLRYIALAMPSFPFSGEKVFAIKGVVGIDYKRLKLWPFGLVYTESYGNPSPPPDDGELIPDYYVLLRSIIGLLLPWTLTS